MTNQHILELVEQKRISPETALELLKAADKTAAIVKLVSEHRLNAVAAAFLLEENSTYAGTLFDQALRMTAPHEPKSKASKKKKNPGRLITKDQHDRVLELYKAGLTVPEIGLKLKMHNETVRDQLAYAGLVKIGPSKRETVRVWRERRGLYLDLPLEA